MTTSVTPSVQAEPGTGAHTDSRQPVVGCQQLSKVFKDFWMRDRARAVDKLDLIIYEKEVFGLLGPNGSGKSTIIKMILGLLKPSHGRVVVFGKSPTDVATKKRIGYLPEESYLYPFLNARETLDYYGKLFQLDHRTRKARIDELLNMVGLEHAQFRPVREYSKGMQRRIGIAQALINDPELLILDEPTTGLDPIGTRQVKDLILELGRRGKTVILSSHLLSDVEDVVDRMAILYGGKIRDEGTCEALLTSKERTLIETDELDDQTIAEIDEIIRKRTGGGKAIRTVSAPRQSLEELFLGVVERAQSEKASTSGAMHGGSTASFLKAEEDEQHGDALIDSLLKDSSSSAESSPDDQSGSTSKEQSSSTPGTDKAASIAAQGASVIGTLLADNDDSTNDAVELDNSGKAVRDKNDTKSKDEEVDLGMIGDLLDSASNDDEDQAGEKESKR
tara:strand:+ start:187650 stop:188996 length:1347 start_codon:yes stop_codon:yes gene_type:complete